MLSVFKPVAETALKPVAGLLKNVSPNAITLLGLIFPVLFFIFLVKGMYAAALVIFVFNGVDMLDGLVARAQKKVTAFGGFLDSTIDRVSDFTVISAFSFAGLVSWEIIAPLIMLTYLISYIRSRTELAAKGKLVADVGLVERSERLLVVFLALLLYAIWPHVLILGFNFVAFSFLVLVVLSLYTVGQRVLFAYRKLQ